MIPASSLQQTQQKTAAIDPAFLTDLIDWFSLKRDGHMGKWQYFEALYDGDPARSEEIWDEWAHIDEPETYMLRSYSQLVRKHALQISELVGPVHTLFDFGPGDQEAAEKNTLPFIVVWEESLKHYVSLDLCADYAQDTAKLVRNVTQGIKTTPLVADFMKEDLKPLSEGQTAVIYSGGTLSNYEGFQNNLNTLSGLVKELKTIRQNLPKGTYVILGLDANQDAESLYDYYKHPVHAAFEINIMHKIKRDVLADQDGFKPESWIYKMAWYPKAYQFCHITAATEDQSFKIEGQQYKIKRGQQFVVDNSYKFPVGVFQQAAVRAGFNPLASYLDDEKRMALHVIKAN